jgi:hypothetical protein
MFLLVWHREELDRFRAGSMWWHGARRPSRLRPTGAGGGRWTRHLAVVAAGRRSGGEIGGEEVPKR